MDLLLRAVGDRLKADGALVALTQSIYRHRNPDDPKLITDPVVVYRLTANPDRTGYHGAATDPGIEVKVWGYGDNMKVACDQAAQRIDELMLQRFTLSNGSVTTRVGADPGWQDVDVTDPKTIHMQNIYRCRYWSAKRITALTT